jgi:MSHA pilin protein MshA
MKSSTRNNGSFQSIKQKGMTLIELIIVVVILGILAVVIAAQFTSGTTNSAKAAAIYEGAQKMGTNWTLINQFCGKSTTISGNPIPAAGKTALDVLLHGDTTVNATYATCYGQSNVKSLNMIAQGADGAETIEGFGVTLSGGGASMLNVSYATVPDEIVLKLVQKYGSGVTALAASDNSNNAIQYGTSNGDGTRTLTVLVKP